jgi:XTP/dITP diphosphohydrolase
MKRLLIATTNAHKTQEIRAMLGAGWDVSDLRAHPALPVPDETGDTFEANAIIKAESASAALPDLLVLSDDSGLEVDALGGDPGVRSARYAGESATDADNRERLKAELGKIAQPAEGFRGRFQCSMAVARGGRALKTFHGAVEGRLVRVEEGEGGFGYDPLFIPDGYDHTFGVLPADLKNRLSHRSRALAQVVDWLAKETA